MVAGATGYVPVRIADEEMPAIGVNGLMMTSIRGERLGFDGSIGDVGSAAESLDGGQ